MNVQKFLFKFTVYSTGHNGRGLSRKDETRETSVEGITKVSHDIVSRVVIRDYRSKWRTR